MSIKGSTHLVEQLDLQQHIERFEAYFCRDASLFIEGDRELHFRYIKALSKVTFKAPTKSQSFEPFSMHLKKQGILNFEQIFEIIKVVRYFRYMRNQEYEALLGEWFNKIEIPESFLEIEEFFREDGTFDESKDEEVYGLSRRIEALKLERSDALKRLMFSQKISPYLVDKQVHYINSQEVLLMRGGFNHVIKGSIIGRSSGGFFYIFPEILNKNSEQIRQVETLRETLFYAYAKKFSLTLSQLSPFIKFIDKEFDKFDNYQARVLFAKDNSFEILNASKGSDIVLKDFKHPAIAHAKSVDVDFTKSVLMITGVNAGGKTMLLKSIMSAAFMAKYLIPMQINIHKSRIASFKHLNAIIDDPQNVKDDISTFAGRMQSFSHLFKNQFSLVGVDEIELGTDSDEAAALFKVMLDELIAKKQKIVVTTHHKRLAALMADRDDVELMAAIYDEAARKPTYEFLQGIIGKSYAFETAIRYGINHNLVQKAKVLYGENHEKLNLLIERGSELERSLKHKNREVDERLESLKTKERALQEATEALEIELQKRKNELSAQFQLAIDEAKKAAKESDLSTIHKIMNKANKKLPKKSEEQPKKLHDFKLQDTIKYRGKRGTIIGLKDKEATIEIEGFRMRVKRHELKPSGNPPKKSPKVHLTTEKSRMVGLKLDLHGLRAEEAMERLDVFLSDALVQGFDEVIVYHGIGEGKLSYAVKNFLDTHPKVVKYEDAPAHMGGFGAKIITL